MFGIHDLPLFIAASFLLALTPGPDTALVVAHTIRNGLRGGFIASAGITLGCLIHIAAATLGVSALLMASATAFTALKWVGAAYLAYLGVRMMLSAGGSAAEEAKPVSSRRSIFWQGLLTNVTNPKVALFFLAFLPQFIDAAAPSKAAGFALLGVTFTVVGVAYLIGVALLVWRSAAAFRAGSPFRIWVERVTGAAFVAFAVKLALAERP